MSKYNQLYSAISRGESDWYKVVPTQQLYGTESIVVSNWCEVYCGRSNYIRHHTGYYFKNQQHAFEFLLRWG